MERIRLTVRTADDGSWGVRLATLTTRAVEGHVPADVVESLHSRARELRAPTVVLRPDLDPWLTHLEETFGRALGAAVLGDPAIAAAWARHAGRAEAQASRRLVMLEADDAALTLPWELLAERDDRAPMEAEGTGVVVLLGEGSPQPPPDGPLSVEILSDAPDDPLVQKLAAVGRDAAGPRARRLVHLVDHGTDRGFGLALGSDGRRGMGTAVHGHQPTLQGAWLVALAICESGARADLAVQRVLAAGAHAVLAPTDRLDRDMVEVVASTLSEAATDGDLVAAVVAARRAVRAEARPYPDARWFRLRLTVASAAGLVGSLVGARADAVNGPAGGATGGSPTCLAEVMAVARADAEASLIGFVGLEHVLLALADAPAASPALRYAMAAIDLRARFAGWRFVRAQEACPTPRLAALLMDCSPELDIAAFEEHLRAQAAPSLRWLLGGAAVQDSRHKTWATVHTRDALPDVTALEVLGGPEDGRRIALAPGRVIGRWAEPARADVLLYRETTLTDPRLSRAHVRLEAGGCTALAKLARVRGGDRVVFPRGSRCDLLTDDLLHCSAVTVLRAV
jgi:hypothetical protein